MGRRVAGARALPATAALALALAAWALLLGAAPSSAAKPDCRRTPGCAKCNDPALLRCGACARGFDLNNATGRCVCPPSTGSYFDPPVNGSASFKLSSRAYWAARASPPRLQYPSAPGAPNPRAECRACPAAAMEGGSVVDAMSVGGPIEAARCSLPAHQEFWLTVAGDRQCNNDTKWSLIVLMAFAAQSHYAGPASLRGRRASSPDLAPPSGRGGGGGGGNATSGGRGAGSGGVLNNGGAGSRPPGAGGVLLFDYLEDPADIACANGTAADGGPTGTYRMPVGFLGIREAAELIVQQVNALGVCNWVQQVSGMPPAGKEPCEVGYVFRGDYYSGGLILGGAAGGRASATEPPAPC